MNYNEWICAWKSCHHLWACWSCVWPGAGPRLWFLRKKGTAAPNTLTCEYYRRSFSARRPSTRPTMQSGQFALLQLMLCNVPLDLLVSESRVAARSLERNRWCQGQVPCRSLSCPVGRWGMCLVALGRRAGFRRCYGPGCSFYSQ